MTARIVHLLRNQAAALLVAAALSPPAFAASERPQGFCPVDFKLWGALCLNDRTGDVTLTQTKGPAYARIKASMSGIQLCSAWDIQITTQIEDFGVSGGASAERLSNAGVLQSLARELCKLDRHLEAASVYESIFAALD